MYYDRHVWKFCIVFFARVRFLKIKVGYTIIGLVRQSVYQSCSLTCLVEDVHIWHIDCLKCLDGITGLGNKVDLGFKGQSQKYLTSICFACKLFDGGCFWNSDSQ